MSTITTKDGTEIFYKDWGHGQPVVFHHGWPFSSDDWDTQTLFFVQHGYRVIGIDRRGHGRSSQVSDGHDMDHYAADAAAPAQQRGRRRATTAKPVAGKRSSSNLGDQVLALAAGKTQQEITAACKGARPNHVGAAIARHKRAGRIEERDGKLYTTHSTGTEQRAAV
jgi:hypothetical protein